MVNGRVGQNNFTHVSPPGKHVVNYVCVPYELLCFVSDFCVHLMSDLVGALDYQGVNKIPDHSLLTWSVNGCIKQRCNADPIPTQNTVRYNTSNIPVSFLNDDSSYSLVVETIYKIEHRTLNICVMPTKHMIHLNNLYFPKWIINYLNEGCTDHFFSANFGASGGGVFGKIIFGCHDKLFTNVLYQR